jgi:membrane protease YdiL (CAAX protease family)
MNILRLVIDAVRGPQRKPTLILLSSPVLMLVWKYYCAPEFLASQFGGVTSDPRVAGAIASFLSCFVLLGLLPALTVKLVFRERLRDYGVGLGIPARTWRTLASLAPVFLLVAYLGADDRQILAKFPINPRAGDSARMFALHALTYLVFYVGWEFHFRGFLLFGLRASLGDANAILIQAMVSALLHIGSPASETFGAILAGFVWGVLALRTQSLVSGLGQHYLLGIALDAFICFR